MPPSEFVPTAEETGLIVPIGRWVLEQACTQLARWRRDHLEAAGLTVSVNVAARQFADDRLVDDVVVALESSGLPPEALTIEVTESALIAETAAAAQRLTELAGIGVGVALEDFGTGCSSLSHLRNFPVSTLEDRLVVPRHRRHRAADGPDDGRLEQHPGAAHRRGGPLETGEQLDQFRMLACDGAQGYLLGRAGDALTTEALLLCGVDFERRHHTRRE